MNEPTTTEIFIDGYGSDEAEAYANALRVADRDYHISTSLRIRKLPRRNIWRVVFLVYARNDGREIPASAKVQR